MMAGRDSSRARRYLLGESSEEDTNAIEEAYFARDAALDDVAAAEEALIEDYLAGELDAADRLRFERIYLAAPHRRRRVETIRQLLASAAAAGDPGDSPPATRTVLRGRLAPWLAAAAAILLVASGTIWWLERSPPAERVAIDEGSPAAPVAPPVDETAAPGVPPARVLAFLLSPATVRSAAAGAPLIVPAGTDMVALQLESTTPAATLQAARGVVRSIDGDLVWEGPAAVGSDLPPGVLARLDVPAGRLEADDYVVDLFEIDRAGREQERERYFLRVRTP